MSTAMRERTTPLSPAARWTTATRAAAAVCLFAAGILWLVAELIGFGLDDVAELQFMADAPVLAGIGLTCDILAVPFLAGATLAWFALARPRSPKLALIGAIALAFGLSGQSVLNGVDFAAYQIMNSGHISAAALSTALGANPVPSVPGLAFMITFEGGAAGGIILLMIAVWRSHTLPRTAVVLVIAFQVLSMLPVPFPGTVLAAVGMAWMAVHILRTPKAAA